jgi:hypothetical protein
MAEIWERAAGMLRALSPFYLPVADWFTRHSPFSLHMVIGIEA